MTPPSPPAPSDLEQAVRALADDPAVKLWLQTRHIGRAAGVAQRLQTVLDAL